MLVTSIPRKGFDPLYFKWDGHVMKQISPRAKFYVGSEIAASYSFLSVNGTGITTKLNTGYYIEELGMAKEREG